MTPNEIDQLLDRHRDKFRRLLRAIAAEEEGPDPFSFSLSRYRKLAPFHDDRKQAEASRQRAISKSV
jgi:hypothetical protein